MSNIYLIASREFSMRVRKKSFIFTTLLMPLFFLGIAFAPALISGLNSEENMAVRIIDRSGVIAPHMLQSGTLPYEVVDDNDDYLTADDPTIIIEADGLYNPNAFTVYSRGNIDMSNREVMTKDIRDAIENERLLSYNIENLPEILREVSASDVDLNTVKIDDDGAATEINSIATTLAGIIMTFVMYMFILIYGQMVMLSIIEEKNNRVLELIVTSVKPTHLMLGKILGIGSVAVLQMLIWGVIVVALTQFVMPEVAIGHPALQALMAVYGTLGYVSSVVIYMLIFLVGGFLLYSSIYAAIGASVDNAQDASQFQSFSLVPIILALICAMSASENPDSAMAFWLSIIPLTSPMVMVARIPSGVPTWEIAISIGLLVACIMLFVWLTAKIYRVGIFMYGKKPTIKEIMRWVKYS